MLKKSFSFNVGGVPTNYDVSVYFFGAPGRDYTAVQLSASVGEFSYSETANLRESPKDNSNIVKDFCDRFESNYKTSRDSEQFFIRKGFSVVVPPAPVV